MSDFAKNLKPLWKLIFALLEFDIPPPRPLVSVYLESLEMAALYSTLLNTLSVLKNIIQREPLDNLSHFSP